MKSLLPYILIFVLLCSSACSFQEIASPLTVQEELQRKAKVEELYQKSLNLFAQGDKDSLESADAALLMAIELLGKEARLLDARGCIAWARGDKERARQFFKEALTYDKEFSESYEHLAYLAWEAGENEVSIELYQKALMYDPNNYRARNNHSIELSGNGWLIKSRDELLKALHSAKPGEQGPILKNLEQLNKLLIKVASSK